jgi:DNA-binding transcriptional LysR family regulator
LLHRYLEHFKAVAEKSSILKASEELNISQPALSRSLRILEEILETQLFIRKSKGVEITDCGNVLYKQVCSMGNEFRYALDEIKYLKNRKVRKLRIGSGLVWQYGVLPKVVQNYTESHKDIQIKVITGFSQTLYDQLMKGELDIIFCDIGNLEPMKGIIHEHLMNVCFSFFACWNHPIFNKIPITEKELNDYDFAVFSHNNQTSADAQDDHQLSVDYRRRVKYISGSMISLLEVVSSSEYLTSLPHSINRIAEQFGLKEINPDMRRATFPSGMIYHQSSLDKDHIRNYIEAIRLTIKN